MATAPSYVYTTQEKVERMMSIRSVQEYSNDDPNYLAADDEQIILDLIYEATDTINSYCLKWYTEAMLATSMIVERHCTWMVCYLLSQRRGEPMRYEGKFNEAVEYFKSIESGARQIPRLPQRSDLVPVNSNYVIDDRFAKARSRVQRETSSGEPYSGQPVDITIDPNYPNG